MALFPTVFTPVPPNDGCMLSVKTPEAAEALGVPIGTRISDHGPLPGHPLGFTKQGCDVFSRIVHGTGTSLSVGIIVTVLVAIMGIVIGAFAGYFGGWLDSVLMRVGDIFFAIPYILAAVVIMSMFLHDRNIWIISLAIGFFAWPSTARILRSEVLRVKQLDFVTASEAIGLSKFRTMFTHVMPNSIAPVIIISTVGLAGAITAVGSPPGNRDPEAADACTGREGCPSPRPAGEAFEQARSTPDKDTAAGQAAGHCDGGDGGDGGHRGHRGGCDHGETCKRGTVTTRAEARFRNRA